MNVVAQVFALVAAAVHLLAFTWESLLFLRPGVHRDIFRVPTADVPAAHMWAFNVGFYNLFLGAGPIVGLIAVHTGHPEIGRALVIYCCAFMFLAGIALFASDRMALGRPRGAGVVGALSQTVPALVTLVAMFV